MPNNVEVDGWMFEEELTVIERMAGYVPHGGIIVEVGSYVGKSAISWASSADPSVTVYCFDPFHKWDEFCKNTKQFSNIVPIKGLVPNESTYKDSRKIDMFFIDASHYNPNDWDIILHFLPFVKPGGYIVGHDYSPYYRTNGIDYPDVNLNVHRLEEMFDLKVKVNNRLWWFKKPLNWTFDPDRYVFKQY